MRSMQTVFDNCCGSLRAHEAFSAAVQVNVIGSNIAVPGHFYKKTVMLFPDSLGILKKIYLRLCNDLR